MSGLGRRVDFKVFVCQPEGEPALWGPWLPLARRLSLLASRGSRDSDVKAVWTDREVNEET